MTKILSRFGAMAVLTTLAAACSGSGPSAPTTAPAQVASASTSPPAQSFPAQSGASRVFVFDHADEPVSLYTTISRFVLYDDGAFALQFAPSTDGALGGYTEAAGVVTFEWEGSRPTAPWGARGTLQDGALTIHYNSIMLLTDFEDAVYRLTSQ